MHSLALSFEPIESKHLAAIMDIEVEAYPEPWTEGMFRDEIRNANSYFYVMMLDGVLIGYGGFWKVVDEAHITSVTVCKDYRGKGYGRQLLAHILHTAARAGTRAATLEVRPSNEVARQLYLDTGFRQVGIRRKYYPKSNEDAIIMVKDLPAAPQASA